MVDKYLKMDLNAVRTELVADVILDPFQGEKIIEELKKTEEYGNDYIFRLVVDSAKIIVLSIMGRYKELFPLCVDLIERASSYGMWRELSIGWNTLGNAYYGMGIFERAVECYLKSIGNGKRHGLHEMTSIGYNNISLIYMNFEVYDKTSKYLGLAFESLEKAKGNLERYAVKKVQYNANLVIALCKAGKLEKVEEVIASFPQKENLGENRELFYYYYLAHMFYAFYKNDFEQGKREYYFAQKYTLEKESIRKMTLLEAYISLCKQFGMSYDFYIKELKEIEEITDFEIMVYGIQSYESLRNYYKSIGDRAKYEELTETYIEIMKRDFQGIRDQQFVSMEIAESFYLQKEEIEEVEIENKELQLIAEEAIRNKNALQVAYQRIETINEVGRKLTASLDLDEVVKIMYRNLKNNIPIDIFVVMIPDSEKKKLKSLVFYSHDELQEETEIDFNDERSIFVECFKKQKTILSWDKQYEAKFANQRAEEDRPSAIFLPLYLDGKTIGVCSLQYHGANTYTEKHLKFLEEISPYLAIAINNALRSWELEKEIKSHLETQHKLELLNERLERISSLDGLTEINGRRTFEEKIIELLIEAHTKKIPVCIFMIDIDNFKAYNDTYGHLEGDEVLKAVAHIFRKNMDEVSGLSARFGGEEFIGAGIGLSKEESFRLADKIRREIQEMKIEHRATKLGILTVSVGVAMAHRVEVSMKSDLMKLADTSLYEAKNSGKNMVVLTEI